MWKEDRQKERNNQRKKKQAGRNKESKEQRNY